MKLVVTGAGGQLGQEVIEYAEKSDHEVIGLTRQALDITAADQIDAVLPRLAPRMIINAAAYTKVDAAEADRERAYAVNAAAAGLLARWCHRSRCILLHVSTDYVFDGLKPTPYGESDAIGPLNAYGTTKAQGETLVRSNLAQHLILRTSWLYSAHGQNFVKTIIALAAENDVLRIVADQYGSPTSAAELAKAILHIASQLELSAELPWGTYHFCCRGVVSWHDFAAEIIRLLPVSPGGRTVQTVPIPTSAYPTPARRPQQSGLNCRRFETEFNARPAGWSDALRPVVRQLTQRV